MNKCTVHSLLTGAYPYVKIFCLSLRIIATHNVKTGKKFRYHVHRLFHLTDEETETKNV